jgi:UDP-3-O-[3-hydroxymyristoyl] N-acetylglucosamine deacetylase
LRGLYRSFRGGHKLNAMALSALLADPDAWMMVPAPVDRRKRAESRAELLSGLLAPAFAPKAA